MANNDDEFDVLRNSPAPAPRAQAKERALEAARAAFNLEKTSAAAQGTQNGLRLTERATRLWSEIMQRKLIATPALAGLVALPVAGYATFYLLQEAPFGVWPQKTVSETGAPAEKPADTLAKGERDALSADNALPDAAGQLSAEPQSTPRQEAPAASATALQESIVSGSASPNAAPTLADAARSRAFAPSVASKQMADQAIASLPAPPEPMRPEAESRDRIEDFKSNPVRSALEDPVSTFSIDVDTASYSFVRRSLKEGLLPQPDSVRVEEMINYFPYDWKGPDEASTPFNSTITVMPTPWNDNTRLMHVAIKGYDVQPAEKPKANLVFLLDVSGSMDEPDKLPLLKSAFRLLVNKLGPDDTVSIVSYAGNAGTVLEPTKASEREKILNAVDTLTPGGSTAGVAGIREAYRLAEKSFVKDGVNRVMLATDGDFNVGQTDDNDLKRIIEEKRKSGVFLSVFGFGRGNLNDQMMQTIAQNGNGTAAYVDTLAEAEKVLVQDASSTLFPIAKDVKIQIEFNPQKVSEYRLIGYETRALNREDFNNDRVDAGEIGSGHAVTAIYEITPNGSPATAIDDLRYGQARTDNPTGVANADEYAFVKIRYKAPDGDISKLISTPVTSANEVANFDAASADQRFSVAVGAFGQKLRGTDQVAGMNYDRIAEIATAARGADPFGYRAEFLSLVRLAAALDGGR
jgi:Ca-activated chloride channel family protein